MTTLVCSPSADEKKYIFMSHRKTLEKALREKTEFNNHQSLGVISCIN